VRKQLQFVTAAVFATAAGMVIVSGQAGGVDAGIPAYSRASGVSGSLSSVGSDTLNNLMTLWSEDFKGHYPNVNIQVQGAGTSTAPPALTEGGGRSCAASTTPPRPGSMPGSRRSTRTMQSSSRLARRSSSAALFGTR
jgi:ABC-type phosphate transport system substrate-binding protein